jgi:DNA-binding NarL/FixJ family response regulator
VPLRVLIVDDHAVVREGLRSYLELQDGIEVVGEAGDGEAAIREVEALTPDVVLMDLVMPRLDGAGAMRVLRDRFPDVRVIVLTSFSEDDQLLPAIRAGAAGYLLKTAAPAEVVRAVREAAAGGTLLDPAIATRLVGEVAARGDDGLTPREREVLEALARGLSNKRIAFELEIAERTVKAHVGHILAKLGVPDRTAAALWAQRHGS